MANQILARLGIVMGVDSGELEVGLNAAKEKFKGFTKEVTRQTNEAARQTIALKIATESYGKTLTEVEKLELELRYGRLAGNKVEEKTLNLLRQQAAAYDAVKAAADKANKAKMSGGSGLNTYQQQAIMYQTTDTITSLISGQNPLMVLMQQGGQLKDQFGGLRPMFSALAASITPVGVALASVGASILGIGYATYKANAEQKEFNNSIALTGNLITMSEKQFTALSVTIATKYHTSLSDTRQAMQALVSSGQFANTSFTAVADVIGRVAKMSGLAASEVAQKLIPSLDGSASSAKRLNDQYHFLTVEQYSHIRALEASGQKQEAIRLTADALNKKLEQHKESLTPIAKLWDAATDAMASYWQKAKDALKSPDSESKVAQALADLNIAKHRAESKAAGEKEQEIVRLAREKYERLVLEHAQYLARVGLENVKQSKEDEKIDYIASGRAAKARQLRREAEDFDEKTRAANAIVAGDKISQIEQDRVKKMLTAIRAARAANLDDDGAMAKERAQKLSAELIAINAEAAKEEREVYAKAKEAYRESAQAAQDALDREKERIEFYKEHIFLQGTDLKIAESRLKTEQEIAALYAKKDNGKQSDKDEAADRLRDLQKQREAIIEQGDRLKMLQDMNQSVYSNMSSAIDNFVKTGKLSMKDFTRSVIQDLIAIAMKAQMLAMFKGFSFFGGGSGVVNLGTVKGSDMMQAFADGGSPPVGVPSIVGERGPELFIPRTAGTIIPNDKLASSIGGTTNVTNNYINAIDTKSFEQRLLGSSNTIWAANQYANKSLAASGGRS